MGRIREAFESGEIQDRVTDEALILASRAVRGIVKVADAVSDRKERFGAMISGFIDEWNDSIGDEVTRQTVAQSADGVPYSEAYPMELPGSRSR